jgi:transcriptional/translational regulatory protein YebC/TACO1
MAGHSKWANIQRREGVQLRRRDRALARPAGPGLQPVRYEGYGPGALP